MLRYVKKIMNKPMAPVRPLYNLLSFPSFDTKNGVLTMFQGADSVGDSSLPFAIQRVLVMKDMSPRDIRGGHTHHATRQALFAIAGACTVTLDNGAEKTTVRLEAWNEGIFLPPYVWHVMADFAPGTILLVLADTAYDEKDYIRDYDEFQHLVH